jgi:alpha-glucosidase
MVRWVQNGIFQPRFSIHSVNTDNTVTEPWMYGEETKYIREAVKFRYRLFPYLYSLMERAHESGLPILEPMCSAFQQDPACYDDGIDFMVGDSLLVANVVEKGAKTRRICLPKGQDFYDFYSREKYEGGKTVEIPVTIASIPLMIRSGGIIPMALNQMDNLMTQKVTGIHLICAPDRNGSFVLYEDDGLTTEYRKGDFRKSLITVHAGERALFEFQRSGAYHTDIDRVLLDVIHREGKRLTMCCFPERNCLIFSIRRDLKKPTRDGITIWS